MGNLQLRNLLKPIDVPEIQLPQHCQVLLALQGSEVIGYRSRVASPFFKLPKAIHRSPCTLEEANPHERFAQDFHCEKFSYSKSE